MARLPGILQPDDAAFVIDGMAYVVSEDRPELAEAVHEACDCGEVVTFEGTTGTVGSTVDLPSYDEAKEVWLDTADTADRAACEDGSEDLEISAPAGEEFIKLVCDGTERFEFAVGAEVYDRGSSRRPGPHRPGGAAPARRGLHRPRRCRRRVRPGDPGRLRVRRGDRPRGRLTPLQVRRWATASQRGSRADETDTRPWFQPPTAPPITSAPGPVDST